jgi:hypothetical protein
MKGVDALSFIAAGYSAAQTHAVAGFVTHDNADNWGRLIDSNRGHGTSHYPLW